MCVSVDSTLSIIYYINRHRSLVKKTRLLCIIYNIVFNNISIIKLFDFRCTATCTAVYIGDMNYYIHTSHFCKTKKIEKKYFYHLMT